MITSCFVTTYLCCSLVFLFADICCFRSRPFGNDDNSRMIALNQYVAFLPMVLINLLVLTPVSLELVLRLVSFDTEFSHFGCIFQLAMFIFIFEFVFYMTHRMLHIPFIFDRVHEIHHRARICIGFGAIYCHPLEFLVGNILPVLLGPLLLQKSHNATLCLWAVLVAFTTVCSHSGYKILDSKMDHLRHHMYITRKFGIFGWFG